MSRPDTKTPPVARPAVNDPLGLRPSLENCRLSDLKVDAGYQRSTDNDSSKALIRRIAVDWDWRVFNPLTVSRRSDGTLWVVDGQHRLAAARLRKDMFDIPCVVTSYDSRADEARTFVTMNIQRRAMGALDLFRAALATSDGKATEIEVLISSAGLTLAKHSNFTAWKPGEVSNIGGIRACHRKYGREVTALALQALSRGFVGQVLRYAGTIFSALGEFIARKDYEGEFCLETLVQVLSAETQQAWVIRIEAQRAQNGMQRAAAGAQVLAAAYREARAANPVIIGIDGGGEDMGAVAVAYTSGAQGPELLEVCRIDQGNVEKVFSAPKAKTSDAVLPPPPPKRSVRDMRPTLPPRIFVHGRAKPKQALPSAGVKAWCDQCDRQRFGTEIERCRDGNCPFAKSRGGK